MADLETTNEYPIYVGVWTNWSYGRITGATLTLSHRNGALLTAFLAIYIQFVGTSCWKVISFALHQYFSSYEAQDGLYHQRQTILRNSSNGMSNLLRFMNVVWAWRHLVDRPFRRTLPVLAVGAVSMTIFAVASVFSAKIASGTNEVLISSPACGFPSVFLDSQAAYEKFSTIYQPQVAREIRSAAEYVQQCYSEYQGQRGCSSFVKRRLSSTVDRNAGCPFPSQICRQSSRNIRLDTGYIYTDSDLGLNSASDLRRAMRIVTHCGPLALDGYRKMSNYSTNTTYMRYFYGSADQGPGAQFGAQNDGFTYEYEQLPTSKVRWENFNTAKPDYSLGSLVAKSFQGSIVNSSSNFFPTHDLYPFGGDVFLVFLSANDMLYTQQINDEWYSAHRLVGQTTPSPISGRVPIYISDEPASPLGCKLQYQLCDPRLPPEQNCTQLGSSMDMANLVTLSGHPTNDVTAWLINATTTVQDVVRNLGAGSLSLGGSHGLGRNTQLSPPDDQWQSDVENWQNIVLATLQRGAVTIASGPSNPAIREYFWRRPETYVEKYICSNQKIRSTAYSNFSVLWLVIVFIVGGLLIILGHGLESLVFWIAQRHHVLKYSQLEWWANDLLQTQRLAHEANGIGPWKGCTGPQAIPVTEKGQTLACLDVHDTTHPRLEASFTNDSKVWKEVEDHQNQIGQIHPGLSASDLTEELVAAKVNDNTTQQFLHRSASI